MSIVLIATVWWSPASTAVQSVSTPIRVGLCRLVVAVVPSPSCPAPLQPQAHRLLPAGAGGVSSSRMVAVAVPAVKAKPTVAGFAHRVATPSPGPVPSSWAVISVRVRTPSFR
jgi:hypothetical protein